MPPVDIDDDTTEEVLNVAADTDDAPADAKEDRGDEVESGEDKPQAKSEPETTEAADDDASADAKSARQHDQRIPKARFDEVNEARKEAERRAQDAEEELKRIREQSKPAPAPAEPAFDVAAKEKEYLELLMEGETEKATAVRMEINAHITEQAEIAAEQRIVRKSVEADLAKASTQAVADYPYLDTPAGADALQLIIWKRFALQEQGHAPADALRMAVAAIAPKFQPNDDADDGNTPGRSSPTPAKVADTRTAKALERGMKDSQAQAPAMNAGIGNRQHAGRLDVETMTDEQFAELPAAEKRRLRGD